MSRKPSVTTSCPANAFASPGERIVEFSFYDHRDQNGYAPGGLISLRTCEGIPTVEVYRTEGAIKVSAPEKQPGPPPAPPARRYLAIKLDAGNSSIGNPRRGWLVYLDTPEAPLLGWVEDGYAGEPNLYNDIDESEHRMDGTPRQTWRALRDSGRVRVVSCLSVPFSEVRDARRTPFALPV